MENVLYYGDNLDIMQCYLPDESVDLVYADPPFKQVGVTFKKAPRAAARAAGTQAELPVSNDGG